jgi:hypothetical protein
MSQKSDWRRFVRHRRRQLHDAYPCAVPTHQVIWPRQRARVGPLTRICRAGRDELYQRLASEYVAAHKRQKGEAA